VHVTRNVLAKVPFPLKEETNDKLRDIFYAPNREIAVSNYRTFVGDYQDIIPSAVNCLGRSIKSCLTFFSLPKHE